MAIITSTLILRTNALLHLYASWLLIARPAALPTQNLVVLLGNSMRLPDPSGVSFTNASAASAMAGLVVVLLSLSDLIATTIPTFAYDELWDVMAPVRGTFYLSLAAWVYLTGKQAPGSFGTRSTPKMDGWADELKNSVVFSWAFVQMSIMFWAWMALKDERKKLAEERLEAEKARKNRL